MKIDNNSFRPTTTATSMGAMPAPTTRGTDIPAHLWNGEVPGRVAEKAYLPRRDGDNAAVSPGTVRHGGGELVLSAAHLYNRDNGSASKADVEVIDVSKVKQLTGKWPIDGAELNALKAQHPEVIAKSVSFTPPETGSLGRMPAGEYSIAVKGQGGPVQAMLLDTHQLDAAMKSTPVERKHAHRNQHAAISEKRNSSEWTQLLQMLLGVDPQQARSSAELPDLKALLKPGRVRV